ncbi:MAG TPA: YfhO family protein, partial [Candidatus Acidoferrum sp.]|nr:YfhO family protein [Candidatus Acidoferrum sp.]
VIGYHGNQLRWYDDLVGGPARTNQFNPRFLNLVGTRYLIGPANAFPEGYFGPKPVVPAISFGQVSILRNENALPRAFFVDSFRVIPERKDITPLILNGSSDLRTLAYFEEDPGMPPSTPSPSDSAWVISHAVDSVLVGVNCAHDRLMVLTDVYYESWHITIDGNPAKLLRADEAFRGVVVPRGSKEVKFTYNSPRYRTGRLITWLTSLYVLVIIGLYVIPGLRKAPTGKPSES